MGPTHSSLFKNGHIDICVCVCGKSRLLEVLVLVDMVIMGGGGAGCSSNKLRFCAELDLFRQNDGYQNGYMAQYPLLGPETKTAISGYKCY